MLRPLLFVCSYGDLSVVSTSWLSHTFLFIFRSKETFTTRCKLGIYNGLIQLNNIKNTRITGFKYKSSSLRTVYINMRKLWIMIVGSISTKREKWGDAIPIITKRCFCNYVHTKTWKQRNWWHNELYNLMIDQLCWKHFLLKQNCIW